MTSHRNCLHPSTSAARAQCRKERAAEAEAMAIIDAEIADLYIKDEDRKDLPHAEKVSLAGNPFYRRYISGRDADWEWYACAEGYLENASLPDSASWVADMTANDLAAAAKAFAEGELGDCPEVAPHPMEDL